MVSKWFFQLFGHKTIKVRRYFWARWYIHKFPVSFTTNNTYGINFFWNFVDWSESQNISKKKKFRKIRNSFMCSILALKQCLFDYFHFFFFFVDLCKTTWYFWLSERRSFRDVSMRVRIGFSEQKKLRK